MGFFKRRPAIQSSGHQGDDQLLAEILKHSDLNSERHWVHYLYVLDEPAARRAAVAIEAGGWSIQRVDSSSDGNGWVVIAEKVGAVTNPETVRAARDFFEGIAATVPGGDYDGWEASL